MDHPTHYEWTPDDAPASPTIRIAYDAIDGLIGEIMRAFGAVPKRGAETGGLLLGRREGGKVVIDAFRQVHCEHRLGPGYDFTDKDHEAFAVAVAEAREGIEGNRPVGIFRSTTGEDGLTPREIDRDLLARHFGDGSGVVLLVKPYATRISDAGFFLPTGGELPAVTPRPFPFSRKLLGGGSRRRPEPEPVLATVLPTGPVAPELPAVVAPATAAAPAAPTAGATERTARPFASRKTVWAAALIVAASLGWSAGYFVAGRLEHPPAPEDFSVGLAVAARPDDLLITWSASAPPVRTAIRGRLKVIVSGAENIVPLDLDVLRSGKAVYTRSEGPVRFELEVDQISGSMVRESVEYPTRQ